MTDASKMFDFKGPLVFNEITDPSELPSPCFVINKWETFPTVAYWMKDIGDGFWAAIIKDGQDSSNDIMIRLIEQPTHWCKIPSAFLLNAYDNEINYDEDFEPDDRPYGFPSEDEE